MSTALIQTQQLATANSFEIVAQSLQNKEVLQVLKDTKCKGATDTEFQAFVMLAMTKKLNPFNNEIYFSKYGEGSNSKYFIMVGRHGAIKIANSHPSYKGVQSFEIREGDEFQFDPVNQKILKHIPKLPKGKIIGAWAIAKREGFSDALSICWLDEFNKNNNAWKDYKLDMILYKAETRALRTQFPTEFDGLMLDNAPEKQERLSFKESYSPSPKKATLDDFLSDDDGEPMTTEEPEQEFISQGQVQNFCIEQKKYNISDEAVKTMLKEKGYSLSGSRAEIFKEKFYEAKKELINIKGGN